MSKILVVIDMQNDFITGSLGTKEAQAILPAVSKKIQDYREQGYEVIFTRDTHDNDYLDTQEGKNLPVVHCIKGTEGHAVASILEVGDSLVIDKPSFGSMELANHIASMKPEAIELCGVCTDICVVSNALILKAMLPEVPLVVDSSACAGVSPEKHEAALATLQSCQVEVV